MQLFSISSQTVIIWRLPILECGSWFRRKIDCTLVPFSKIWLYPYSWHSRMDSIWGIGNYLMKMNDVMIWLPTLFRFQLHMGAKQLWWGPEEYRKYSEEACDCWKPRCSALIWSDLIMIPCLFSICLLPEWPSMARDIKSWLDCTSIITGHLHTVLIWLYKTQYLRESPIWTVGINTMQNRAGPLDSP